MHNQPTHENGSPGKALEVEMVMVVEKEEEIKVFTEMYMSLMDKLSDKRIRLQI